jgi:hypothetical protein
MVVGLVLLAGVIVVSAGARTSAAPEASVSSVTPTHAKAGQLVTISGTNLSAVTGVTFVAPHVAPIPSPSVSADPNGRWVRAVVPSSVPVGAVQISVAGTTVGPLMIDAGSVAPQPNKQPTAKPSQAQTPAKSVVAPRIVTVSPLSARIGTRVMINGVNFTHLTWVKFGGVRAHVVSASPKSIIAIVPKNARSGKVSMHTSSGGTGVSMVRFTVVR